MGPNRTVFFDAEKNAEKKKRIKAKAESAEEAENREEAKA